MTKFRAAALAALTAMLFGSATFADLPPLPVLDRQLDLQLYKGDWYVHGNIPVGIPFFSDKNAVNYRESYELNADGTIKLICEFNDAANNNKLRRFVFKGFVTDDPSNATWKVQFVWPIRATYKVIYLDDDYQSTIVATPDRKFAWIMARDSQISDARYTQLLKKVGDAGYNIEKMRRVPQL